MNARELSTFLSTLSADDKKHYLILLKYETNDFIEVTLPDKPLSCPICGCVEHVVKNGKRNGAQRYLCKQCNKSFMANTNTILERTHKPLETWNKFIECMVHGMSVLKTAGVCNINKNTACVWRHKVLDALFQLSNIIIPSSEVIDSQVFGGHRVKSWGV